LLQPGKKPSSLRWENISLPGKLFRLSREKFDSGISADPFQSREAIFLEDGLSVDLAPDDAATSIY
jgi:hypothetical protein